MAAQLDRGIVGDGRLAISPSARWGTVASSPSPVIGVIEARLLHREPVGIGGDHAQLVPEAETSTPVRISRVASRAQRALDLGDRVAQGTAPRAARVLTLSGGSGGTSSSRSARSLKLAAPEATDTKPASSAVSSTPGAGRARATSRRSLPGRATLPVPPTVAGRSVRIARSESTALKGCGAGARDETHTRDGLHRAATTGHARDGGEALDEVGGGATDGDHGRVEKRVS